MEVEAMGFKESKVAFASKSNFTDDMKRFVADEAARFTLGSNEAASANLDEMAEKTVRLSAEKNKKSVKEQKASNYPITILSKNHTPIFVATFAGTIFSAIDGINFAYDSTQLDFLNFNVSFAYDDASFDFAEYNLPREFTL